MKIGILPCLVYIASAISNIAIAELKNFYPNVNKAGKKLFGYFVLKLAFENSREDYNSFTLNEPGSLYTAYLSNVSIFLLGLAGYRTTYLLCCIDIVGLE